MFLTNKRISSSFPAKETRSRGSGGYVCAKLESVLKTLFPIVAIVLLSGPARAQYVADSLPEVPFRHQIGVAISPAVVFFSRALGDYPRFSVAWRKRTGKSTATRMTLNFTTNSYNRSVESGLNALTDSGAVVFHRFHLDRHADIRWGREWFKPERMHGPVFGFDLIAGHRSYERWYFYDFHRRDSTATNQVGLGQEMPNRRRNGRVDYAFFGADFSIGYVAHASEKIVFHFLMSPSLSYYVPLGERNTRMDFPLSTDIPRMTFRFGQLEVFVSRKF
jgi:hypothetical protein